MKRHPGHRPITDKEAATYGPLPREGCYKSLIVNGVRAVLIRQPDTISARKWKWWLFFEKPPDLPIQHRS